MWPFKKKKKPIEFFTIGIYVPTDEQRKKSELRLKQLLKEAQSHDNTPTA